MVAVASYTRARRQATLVAFLIDIEERLTDSALEMADLTGCYPGAPGMSPNWVGSFPALAERADSAQ